jgi:hypothetical protein
MNGARSPSPPKRLAGCNAVVFDCSLRKKTGRRERHGNCSDFRTGILQGDASRRVRRQRGAEKFFGFEEKLDGAAAEEDAAVLPRVIHILGDARFVDFLPDESPAKQAGITAVFIRSLADAGAPLEGVEYIRRHFPKTAEIFSQVRDRSVSASNGPSNNSTASPTSTPESQPGKSAIVENDFPMF